MTREVINTLPEIVRSTVEDIRRRYKNNIGSHEEVRRELYGYTKGLRDAGLLTEHERRIVFIYGTC